MAKHIPGPDRLGSGMRVREADPEQQLVASFNRFLGESDPPAKNEAGRDLIRAIFGSGAHAEDRFQQARHQQIVEGMRDLRKRVKPDNMSVREMINQGRRD